MVTEKTADSVTKSPYREVVVYLNYDIHVDVLIFVSLVYQTEYTEY